MIFRCRDILVPKGKIISNGLLYRSLSLSLSYTPRYWQLHACHACTGQWRTSSAFFFFNFYQTRRTHFQGGTRSQRFFFRNGGRHSRFSSAFNVTFDLSYLASHLSYRLETKCILKWKSFVVRRMLQNDTIFQDWYNSASKQVSWNYYFRLEWIL